MRYLKRTWGQQDNAELSPWNIFPKTRDKLIECHLVEKAKNIQNCKVAQRVLERVAAKKACIAQNRQPHGFSKEKKEFLDRTGGDTAIGPNGKDIRVDN